MKHKLYLLPIGIGRIPDRLIPDGAKVVSMVTVAALVGTVHCGSGVVRSYPGLLAEDTTLFIEEITPYTIEIIYSMLKDGRVDKKFSHGTLEYEIKAKLILCTVPMILPKKYSKIFDVEYPIFFHETLKEKSMRR